MAIESDLEEIKELLVELNEKLDALIEVAEIRSFMIISQRSLWNFLMREPDLYSPTDLKSVYE